jgi:hypothetical protein
VGAASLTRSGAERRVRTTAAAMVAATQNGTSGALACAKQTRHEGMQATPRTGDPELYVSGAGFKRPDAGRGVAQASHHDRTLPLR